MVGCGNKFNFPTNWHLSSTKKNISEKYLTFNFLFIISLVKFWLKPCLPLLKFGLLSLAPLELDGCGG